MTLAPSVGTEAHCGAHPERAARAAPCERCGAFACDACFDDEPLTASDEPPRHELACRACRDRTGRGSMPWEDARLGFWIRLGRTLQRALTEPVATFEAIGEGDLGRAAAFSVVTTLIGYGPMMAILALLVVVAMTFGASLVPGLSEPGPDYLFGTLAMLAAIMPAFVVALSLLADLYFAVVFHVAAMLLGGKGSFESSLRAALYSSAVRVVFAPVSLVIFVPLLGSVVGLVARVGVLIWCGFAFLGTARRVHGLSGNAATLAAAAPPLSVLLMLVSVVGLGLALGLARALGERF